MATGSSSSNVEPLPSVTKITVKAGTTHFLTQYVAPEKTLRSATDAIMFRANRDGHWVQDAHHALVQDGLVLVCPFEKELHEKVVILKILLLYTHNEQATPFQCKLGPLFSVSDPASDNAHPDQTGYLDFIIPGRHQHGIIRPDSQMLYRPNATNLDEEINIFQYAGLETQIMGARSSAVGVSGISNQVRLFNVTDPFFAFLMSHKDHFPELHEDDIEKRAETLYTVKKTLVQRVQRFFENSVFPLIKYSDKPGIYMTIPVATATAAEGSLLMIQLQVDYMVVAPQSNYAYKTRDVQLKF